LTLSFSANTQAGDLLLVAFDYDKSVAPSAVTDSQGNVFTSLGSTLSTPDQAVSSVYYAKNIKGGADTVTVKLSASSSYLEIYVSDYSGIDPNNPIDAQAGASGNAGAVSSGTATTTVAGDIIYGYCVADSACTAGSGFTARSTMDANLVEDMVAGSPGQYAATGTATSGWSMRMVALKPAGVSASKPPSFVQQVASASHSNPSSLSLSFSANTLAGDLLLVAFDYDKSVAPSTVTDSQGNAFTSLGSALSTPGQALGSVYYAKNIKGGADTVTVKLSASSSYLEIYVSEYSGIDPNNPIDAQAGASGNAGAVSSGSGTTTVAGDIIYGYCVADSGCAAGSGFTARSTMDGNLVEDMVAGSPGQYAATGTATGGWSMRMVALKGSSSAPSGEQQSQSGAVSLSAASLVFGSVAVGLTSASQTITLTNRSSSTLSIYSIELTGTDPSDFTEVTTCGTNLAAGGNCTIVVIFAPLTSGDLSASLTLTDSASGSPQTVSLTGGGGHDVTLTWTASATPGVWGYYVYRGTASGKESTTPLNSTPIAGTYYADPNVTAGQTYYYVVTALSPTGTTQSVESGEASATVP
jgi:hypothetical protein